MSSLCRSFVVRSSSRRRPLPTSSRSRRWRRPIPSCCTHRSSCSPAPRSSRTSRPISGRQRAGGSRQLAAEYEAAGEPVAGRPALDPRPLDELVAALVAAIAAGDLDDVDHLAFSVGVRATPSELRHALAGPVVASLAAAAHASILLYLFPRFAADGSITGTILRGPARELARAIRSCGCTGSRIPTIRWSAARWLTRCSKCRCSVCPAATSSSRSCTRPRSRAWRQSCFPPS